MTEVLVYLLAQGKVDLLSWETAKADYNCLTISFFRRTMKLFKQGDTLATMLEQIIGELKDKYDKLKLEYDSEFKKVS